MLFVLLASVNHLAGHQLILFRRAGDLDPANVRFMVAANRWWRNLGGSASVLGALLIVVFGLPALDRAVPVSKQAAASATRHEIAGGVSLIPPVGALISKRTRSDAEEGTALFLIGPARYVVAVSRFEGDLPAASTRLRDKIQNMRGYQVTAGETPVMTASGLSGRAGTFTAPGRVGRYAAYLAPGHLIEVTVTGSESDLRMALERVDESMATIAYGGEQK